LLILYTSVFFTLDTIFITANSTIWRKMFVEDCNYPSGPMEYSLAMYSSAICIIANVSYTLENWMVDGLL
ncbi:hypothetical protein SERLA73DRAFT_16532, partial [Serpula lacrymans var. lacrymans S7.3]